MNLVSRTPHMDFAAYGWALAKASGDPLTAVEVAKHYLRAHPRAEIILRSAVESGTTTAPEWAGNLVDHQQMVTAWAEGLRPISAFDALLPFAWPVPLNMAAAVVTSVMSGSTTAEGALKPVTKLALEAGGIEPKKATAITVLTNDLLRFAVAIAIAAINNELRTGVSAATNLEFLSDLVAGISATNSTGDPLSDLGTGLAVVATHAAARPHWIVPPAQGVQLTVYPGNGGTPAFTGMSPTGGQIQGVPVLVSDQLPVDSNGPLSIIVDASQLAMASETITLRASSFTSLKMDDAPGSGAQDLVSLFQTSSTALLAERHFGSQRLRDSAVAVISGADYAAAS